jgi:ribonuclease HI
MTFQNATNVHIYVKGHSGGDIGAWGFVVHTPDDDKHYNGRGVVANATHNLMEIEACSQAMESLPLHPANVTIFTNSTYLRGGIALIAEGTHYDTNILHWQRFLNSGRGHILTCEYMPKAANTGYMRLADTLALNLIPKQFRRWG